MKVGIVNGYFACFHEGHKKYIESAWADNDLLVVVVNNDKQQKVKYGSKAIKAYDICNEVKIWCIRHDINARVIESLDEDKSVSKTIDFIAKELYPNCDMTKYCDGDRNINNIPIEEKEVCEKNNVKIKDLGNKKIASSSEMMKLW